MTQRPGRPGFLLTQLLCAAFACGPIELSPFVASLERPVVVAHRGGGGTSPEATLPTFVDLVTRLPAVMVEFDVHKTLDHVLVVIHDETVDRTTNGTGRVDGLTLDALRALDAAYCFHPGSADGTAEEADCKAGPRQEFPLRGSGYRIPTLQEVLGVLPADAWVAVEVKAPGIEDEVAELLEDRRQDRLIVGSLDDEIGRRLQALLPRAADFSPLHATACFALSTLERADFAGCPRHDVLPLPLFANLFLKDRYVERAHELGMGVFYWTVNGAGDIAEAYATGADGVITDFPDRALHVRRTLFAGDAGGAP